MTSSRQLAIAYVAKDPASASRLLSAVPPEKSKTFVEDIPIPQAVTLIKHLQPVAAARIMQNVDTTVAVAIMRDLDIASSSAIVRQMGRTTRSRFLSKLPKRTQVALERLLTFAPGAVGAHMTTNVATLSAADSVASALDTIRQSGADHSGVVYVLDDRRNLVGVVNSTVALRHPEETRLSAVLDTTIPQVSAHSKLDAISDPSLWHGHTHLPVIDRKREVVGTISRNAVQSGKYAEAFGAKAVASESIVASVIAALATTAAGLLTLVAKPLAGTVSPGERDDH